MKKELVEVSNLDDYICRTTGKIYIDNNELVLTPGAKDELNKRGVTVEYGPRPQAAAHTADPAAPAGESCPGEHCPADNKDAAVADLEGLLLAVAAMLKSQYGVTNPEELKKLSCQVVKTIHENI